LAGSQVHPGDEHPHDTAPTGTQQNLLEILGKGR
jgi:hypothetical protein